MKSKMLFFFIVVLSAVVISCSDDEEKRIGDADITHEGVKWNIASVNNYSLMEVGTSGVTSKTGNLSNAGSFYFVDGATKGSFEMNVDGYNKEDFFDFTKGSDGSISIVTVTQNVGATTNQNILVISGSQTSDTEIILDAVSIVKESSASGIFTLTATTITLVKE